ncbi:MAG: hypothetical protein AABX51_06620 [Nanoarchaeota archaeon]
MVSEHKSQLAERLAVPYKEFVSAYSANQDFLNSQIARNLLKEIQFRVAEAGAEISGNHLIYSKWCLKHSKELLIKLKEINKEFEINMNSGNFSINVLRIVEVGPVLNDVIRFIPDEVIIDHSLISGKLLQYRSFFLILSNKPKDQSQLDNQLSLLSILISKVEALKTFMDTVSKFLSEINKKIQKVYNEGKKVTDKKSIDKYIKKIGEVLELFHELENFANSHYESIYSGLPEATF